MNIFTIGFTKKTAEEFFEALNNNNIDLLIDTRISNNTQLAGFTKASDLHYFLRELCNASYIHRPDFAPTKKLLNDWRSNKIDWAQYEKEYTDIQEQRGTYKNFVKDFSDYKNVCILCSEAEPKYCHRRILAEMIKEHHPDTLNIIHL